MDLKNSFSRIDRRMENAAWNNWERLESDVFFLFLFFFFCLAKLCYPEYNAHPSRFHILLYNPRKWISQDGFLLLGKLSSWFLSFFFFFLSFTEKKSGTFSGIKRTDTKRKTKRKRKFFDAIFISLAAITGIIPGFWDEQTYSCRKEETDIDLLRWRARDNCNNKWVPR